MEENKNGLADETIDVQGEVVENEAADSETAVVEATTEAEAASEEADRVHKPLKQPKRNYVIIFFLIIAAMGLGAYAPNFLLPFAVVVLFYVYWLKRGYTGRNGLALFCLLGMGVLYIRFGITQELTELDAALYIAIGVLYLLCALVLLYAKYRKFQVDKETYMRLANQAQSTATDDDDDEEDEDDEFFYEEEEEEPQTTETAPRRLEELVPQVDADFNPDFQDAEHPYATEDNPDHLADLAHPYGNAEPAQTQAIEETPTGAEDAGPGHGGRHKVKLRREIDAPPQADFKPEFQDFDHPYGEDASTITEDAEHPY